MSSHNNILKQSTPSHPSKEKIAAKVPRVRRLLSGTKFLLVFVQYGQEIKSFLKDFEIKRSEAIANPCKRPGTSYEIEIKVSFFNHLYL